MRRLVRSLLGAASTAVTILAAACAGAVVLVDSDAGKAFLRHQTEEVVGRLLGSAYSADLGRQSVTLEAGRFGIRWDDVEIKRAGIAEPQARAHSIALGFDAWPLLAGRLLVRSLDVSGVDLDLTGAPQAAEVAATAQGLAPSNSAAAPTPGGPPAKPLLPALAQGLIGQAERQLGALQQLGIDDVSISNVRVIAPVAPGGGPFVGYVEQLTMDLGDPRDMRVDGTLRVDRLLVPVHARVDFDPDAKRLVSSRSTVGPTDLKRLLPPGRRDDFRDVRPFGSDSDATLTLDVASPFGSERRSARLGLALNAGHLHQGRGHIDIRSADMSFDYVEGEDRVTLGPNRLRGDGFEASFAGGLTPIYDRPDGNFNGFGLEIESTALRSSVGSRGGQETNGTFRLVGRTNVAARQAQLTELSLRSGDGAVAGTATFGYGSPDAEVRLDLTLADVPAAAVKALWPFDVAVAARSWVRDNVGDAGRVAQGSIALHATRQRVRDSARPGMGYEPGELEMSFALEGLDVRSFGELPNLVDAQGTVETHGGDTLVAIAKAGVAGMPDAAIEGGLVTFARPAVPTDEQRTEIKISGNIRSGLKELASIAERAPLAAVMKLPLDAKDAVGTVKTVANVDMLVGDGLPDGRALTGWKVSLDLADAGSRAPIAGRRIEDVDGTVVIEAGKLSGEVRGTVDGAAGSLTFQRSLAAIPPDGQRMEAKLKIDAADATKLAPVLGDVVSGPIEATIAEGPEARYRADVNLSAASLNFPWLGWRKGRGVKADLAFAVRTDGGRTLVENLELKGDGFAAAGQAEADADGLKVAELRDVSLNRGDDAKVRLERVQNGFSIVIRGDQFDARPLLADIRNDIGAKTAAPKREGRQFDVSASFAKVVGFGNEAISGFALDYAGSGSRVAALSITGKGRTGAPFSVDVSPRGDARAIDIKAQDAGALIAFTGAYGHMEGGKLSLSLIGSSDGGYQGKLEAKNFALVDEPRLSRLVASPPSPDGKSLSQAVGKNLQTNRATFDHASAGISFGKNGLQLSDGIIRGPIFGSSFAGTVYDPQNRIDISGSFMPAYGLNRVFGAIPVVGQILGNGREGGLIGITYKLSGSFSSPKLEVNPISAIAPGIFRNIFAYQ